MPVKREREESDDGFSPIDEAQHLKNGNSVSNSKRRKNNDGRNELLEEAVDTSYNGIDQINQSQIGVEQRLTQVDEIWNKNRNKSSGKVRRRTIDRMTQAPSNDQLLADDESPSECGVIEKLELFNFMCHKAFSLKFGPQTNFIIGRNGSGKSAVLTGISVALGAKATDTDRGTSLKNLIMHGKNVARAIVTIKNEGPEAYKPEEYGSKIIIERVLKAEGTHSLAIRNSNNKTISTKKKTIEQILEYFGITIANPMTILTQTEAKTFLAHSTDKDKFNSFMSGTRLKESFDNLKNIESNVNEIKDILENNKDVYNELKDKFKHAKKVWNSFKDSDEYTKRKELLIGKNFWVEYNENQKLCSKADELLHKKLSEIEKNKSKIENITAEIETMEESKRNLEMGELENYKQQYIQAKQEKNGAKQLINNAKDEIGDINRKIGNAKSKIDSNEKLIAKFNGDIDRERKKIEGSSEENVERLKKFQQKQSEILLSLNKEREDVSSNIEILKQDMRSNEKEMKTELDSMFKELRGIELKIRDAKKQENSNRPESMFTHSVVRLITDLRSQRFQGPVMGPLGLNIELNKNFQKWNTILETLLQRTLTSFLVTNHRDAHLLSGRVKFFGTGSEITVRQHEVFNYSQYIPNSSYPSILDALKINNDNLKCFLVDSLKAHSTLLIPNRMDAQKELDNDHNNLISSVICFVDNNVLRIYKKNGSFQTDPIHIQHNNDRVTRLRIEGDSLVQRFERDYQQMKKSVDERDAEIKSKHGEYKNELNQLYKKVENLKRESRGITQSIEKANDKLENLEVGTTRLESLIEEKEGLESNLSLDIQRLEPMQKSLHEAQASLENQIELYKSISEDYSKAQNVFEEKTKLLKGFDSNIEFNRGNIRTFDSHNYRLTADVEKLNDYLSKTKEVMRSLEQQALEFCSLEEANILPGQTKDSIDDEIRAINRQLEEIENRQGISKERAEINLLKANSELKEIEAKFSQTIELYNNLNVSLENRLDNLLQTTYLTFQEVESAFISALKVRRFRGKIEFNVKKGTLTLKVATKETGPLRSVESFSGGEKSYGQIAFLFAIWGPMHSKVRGLDEFDVFMDNINRRIALKLILRKVSENPKRQTIFITPLGVANVKGLDSKSVHIHEISPPERANI